MSERYELPTDFTALGADELDAHIEQATAEFQARREDPNLTTDDLPELRALAAGIEAMRGEQNARIEAAQAAQAELDQLATQVLGEDTAAAEAEAAEAAAIEQAAAEAAAIEAAEAAAAEAAAEEATAAAAPRRPAVGLNSIRQRQPKQTLPAVQATDGLTPRITAAVDVPGYRSGTVMSLDDLTPGTIHRANALKASGGGVGLIASYHHPFPDELIVNDPGSAPEGSTVALTASKQSRLKGGDLVASGGWCAPSETEYSFLETACPDMLWDAPEIQLSRGGIRYFKTPTLDVAAMTWVHTEADDIAGNTKPCFKIPCATPVEVRCDAVGICVEAGILTQRHFPELVDFYLRQTLVAHEIRIKQVLLNQLAAQATAVPNAGQLGTLSPLFSSVALQAADMIERHSFCDSIALEVVFPWWSRNMMLADVAKRNGVALEEVTTADVQAVFTPLGVRVQWARGITSPYPIGDPATFIGGATPATVWPDTIQYLIYPAGQVQIGRGAEVNLGAIYDSNKFDTNDYTAAFSEECVALVNRATDVRLVTVNGLCANGATGAQLTVTCPAA
jgi:hypothetical protein